MEDVKKTYETRAVGTEPADELFPCSTGVCEDDDAANELPRSFQLFLANTAALVCAEADTVDVLQCFPCVHLHESAHIPPNQRRKA